MNNKNPVSADAAQTTGMGRRRFIGVAALAAGAGLIGLPSCKKDDNDGVNLGSGDTGILNYAYSLEQLEAAFYTQVISTPYANMGAEEMALLTDVRDHEIAHREFFKSALGSSAIQDLQVDFSSINFSDRTSVLTAARSFEDLGVQAYNGAGHLITDLKYLTLAGKIVSVEARHAAYIRELLVPGSFADTTILDPTKRGDYAKTPTEVLSIAGKYIVTQLNAGNLPTN